MRLHLVSLSLGWRVVVRRSIEQLLGALPLFVGLVFPGSDWIKTAEGG